MRTSAPGGTGDTASARAFVLILGDKSTCEEARVSSATLAEMEPSPARALVARIHGGDRSAERDLFLRYARGLRFLVRQRCNDDQLAQDVVQDCFRIALPQLRAGRLENPDALNAFLRGIALNLWSEQQRAGWRERVVDTEQDWAELGAADVDSPLEATTQAQRRTLIQRLIADLPVARDRELLWRYFVLEQDKSQLCAALQLTSEHFDRVLHRAKARFRALAGERGLTSGTDAP